MTGHELGQRLDHMEPRGRGGSRLGWRAEGGSTGWGRVTGLGDKSEEGSRLQGRERGTQARAGVASASNGDVGEPSFTRVCCYTKAPETWQVAVRISGRNMFTGSVYSLPPLPKAPLTRGVLLLETSVGRSGVIAQKTQARPMAPCVPITQALP